MDNLNRLLVNTVEKGWIPDLIIRQAIRHLCRKRLSEISLFENDSADRIKEVISEMSKGPIAHLPHKANQQHYEVPAKFFQYVLGLNLKYSCAYWEEANSLNEAESNSLKLTAQHADLQDGQQVLELGCGWGSLTFWMARSFPNSQILAVSNSASQKSYIDGQKKIEGLTNLEVITADVTDLKIQKSFDRIVSVEMLEHVRNHEALFRKLKEWLHPDGRFFMHIFCHKDFPYFFDIVDETDWMTKHFFSGGMMPSYDLPLHSQNSLHLLNRWSWSGIEYQKTAEAWLVNFDREITQIRNLFYSVYGASQADIWINRWRIFFMACAELFGFRDGEEWKVGHYLFERSN